MSQLTEDLNTGLSDNRAITFWLHAFAIRGSITPHVMPNVLAMGVVASCICIVSHVLLTRYGIHLELPVAPYEIVGAALGLLLVLRTNAGYERWWEARKLWGGIVNQSRNLAISGLTYGPRRPDWQEEYINWSAAFPYACCSALRGDQHIDDLSRLVGVQAAQRLGTADHMPSAVTHKLASMLREAYEKEELDRFAFMQIDRERAQLIDHIGGCERIMKTPLSLAYSIKIRRFIAIFLLTLPFALIHEAGHGWVVPLITMIAAYPLFSLDQLGSELQNPFPVENLSHLPLDDISATIERNVLALRDLTTSDEPLRV